MTEPVPKKRIKIAFGQAMEEWLTYWAERHGLSKTKVVVACVQVAMISPKRLDAALRRAGGTPGDSP